MMTNEPASKKTKLNEDDKELIHVLWDHYRNFLDSIDIGDGSRDADVDEIQELIEIAEASVSKQSFPSGSNGVDRGQENRPIDVVCPCWHSRKDMIPVLLSVAYYHLADGAISQYLMIQQKQQNDASSVELPPINGYHCMEGPSGIFEAMKVATDYLFQSLEWYPFNAATWSMGANFGRMSQSISLSLSRKWYEVAVQASSVLREKALEVLDDESIPDEAKEWIELLVLNQIVGVEYEGDDQEEEEEEKADDESDQKNQNEVDFHDRGELKAEDDPECGDSDGVDTGSYSSSAVESTSRFMCAMLWSMEGHHDRALEHLKPFRLSHRLHPNVWRISPPPKPTSLPTAPSKPPLVFQPKGGIIPSELYHSMTKLLAPDAAYWRETDYQTRGYFSFFHDLDTADQWQPKNLIEEVIIHHLLPRAQQCLDKMVGNDQSNKIRGFEWWAHTRPIRANLGHNLHFDTDESMLHREGKVTHPLLSSVLYLTGGSENSMSPAGATIILDETPDSTVVGKKCWQGIPKDNTFLIFPGDRLHGVLPCSGTQKQENRECTSYDKKLDAKTLINDWKLQNRPDTTDEPSSCQKSPPHRLTFMVGFWNRSVPSTMKHRSLYGPCGPLPPATKEHTWVSEITQGYNDKPKEKRPIAKKSMTATALSQVSPAWEIIDTKKQDGTGVDKNNETEPNLVIPHGIDHRFFVQGAPNCFRCSLFEDRDAIH